MNQDNRFTILDLQEVREPPMEDFDPVSTGSIAPDYYENLVKKSLLEPEPACSSLQLCSHCHQIFTFQELSMKRSANDRLNHHLSYDSLLVAVKDRCYICSLLLKNINALGLQTPWLAESGSAKHSRLWCTFRNYFMDEFISFHYGSAGDSDIQVLELKVLSNWVRGRLATECFGPSTWTCASKERAQKWLQSFSTEGTTLRTTEFLPHRLLQIQLLSSGRFGVVLCEGTAIPSRTQYLTLSHCWGKCQTTRLLTDNIEEYKQSIVYEVLPQSFQDAIRITYDLGFEYIWIDSLCIIQNSQEDWLSNSCKMDRIYRYAACNLVASAARDSNEGLIKPRDIETFLPLRVNVKWAEWIDFWTTSESYVMVNEDWHTAVALSYLASRGWVMQERLLSQFIIHFTARQLFFESRQGKLNWQTASCEQWPSGIFASENWAFPDLLGSWWGDMIESKERYDTKWKAQAWTKIVQIYSRTKFTYDTDKLAAMSGFVKEIRGVTKDEYFAGLWKEYLLYQLLWTTSKPHESIRIEPYTAPTWSWASVKGEISYLFEMDITKKKQHCIRILLQLREARIMPVADQDNTGPVKAGFLRLQGPLWQARLTHSDTKSKAKPFWTIGHSRKKICFLLDVLSPGDWESSSSLDQYEDYMENVLKISQQGSRYMNHLAVHVLHAPTQSVFLLPIYSASSTNVFIMVGLVLVPTEIARGEFRRVGLFFTPNKSIVGSLLRIPCNIDASYYESKKSAFSYSISII
ncbi:heterokaryon incompatibility protein-domain-containing protein [Nemania sp. FL0916]|nr:heterokaryon incompatibility protein-domain-containing protein [Nemania sp. FL0916]